MNLAKLESLGVSSCRVLHISPAGSSLQPSIAPSATPETGAYARANLANPFLSVLVYHRPRAGTRPSLLKRSVCEHLGLPGIDLRDSIP